MYYICHASIFIDSSSQKFCQGKFYANRVANLSVLQKCQSSGIDMSRCKIATLTLGWIRGKIRTFGTNHEHERGS